MRRFFILLLALLVLCGCAGQPGQTPPESRPVPTETEAPPTDPPETAPPETIIPIVEAGRATITVGGDLMMHIPLINSGKSGSGYDFTDIFRYVKETVSGADFAVANLETTLAGTGNGDQYSGFPRFNCPDALADAAKDTGFDMLLTANNHCYDTGSYGFLRTQEVIREREMMHLGTTENADDPRYQIVDINGIRFGMVCYTYGEIDGSGQKSVNVLPVKKSLTEQVNVFDYEKTDLFYEEIGGYITEMKENGAEQIVVFIHWGNEYKLKQNSYQTAIAQNLCDLGADVIVGGHPHVIQPMEMLTSRIDPGHETLCIYSLGNLLSNQRRDKMDLDTGHTEDGMLFTCTFVKYSDGSVYLESAKVLPTWVSLTYGNKRAYRILPLDKEIDDWAGAFDLSKEGLYLAKESYERTMDLLGDSLDAVTDHLEEARKSRENTFVSFG